MVMVRALFGVLCLVTQVFGGSGVTEDTSPVHVGDHCDHHTTTTSQFEEYFDIDRIGNNRSEQNVIDLTLYVEVRNMQEELAILLSASNRSRQHPDYGRTYEIRISNVYTVIYKETLRMSAHHSHNFNFFPGEQFRLRIQITRTGHITVSVPGLQKSLILTVHDERPPIEVSYISFGSRMNAYPVTFYFNCGSGGSLRPLPGPVISSGVLDSQEEHGALPGASPSQGADEGSSRPSNEDDHDDPEEDGGGRRSESVGSQDGEPARCPVCPKPEKCEVIVKACSDTSKDLLMQASGTDSEKQKYFFYFNVYLSSKGEKAPKGTGTDSANQIA